MATTVEKFEYTFGDLVMIGQRPFGRCTTTWYVKCSCPLGQHQFRKLGSMTWHTRCDTYDVEWTITPREYYVQRPANLSVIMGERL